MPGDVVQRAVDLGAGAFDAEAVLRWLADLVRALRAQPEVACGAAGRFRVTDQAATVELHPLTKVPVTAAVRRSLAFEASPALARAAEHDRVTEDLLAPLDGGDPIATCFGRALLAELIESRRAAIGNFGVWSIGQKPDLRRFVRFRPSPAINRML